MAVPNKNYTPLGILVADIRSVLSSVGIAADWRSVGPVIPRIPNVRFEVRADVSQGPLSPEAV
jgi:hypothetical protein